MSGDEHAGSRANIWIYFDPQVPLINTTAVMGYNSEPTVLDLLSIKQAWFR